MVDDTRPISGADENDYLTDLGDATAEPIDRVEKKPLLDRADQSTETPDSTYSTVMISDGESGGVARQGTLERAPITDSATIVDRAESVEQSDIETTVERRESADLALDDIDAREVADAEIAVNEAQPEQTFTDRSEERQEQDISLRDAADRDTDEQEARRASAPQEPPSAPAAAPAPVATPEAPEETPVETPPRTEAPVAIQPEPPKVLDAKALSPELEVENAFGTEDTSIALNIDARLLDLDGSESLSLTVAGVPDGAVLSAGVDQGGGSFLLTKAELAGLTIAPPPHSDENFTLTVTATSTEANGGDTAVTSGTLLVDLTPGADAPTLTLQNTAGNEDTAIALNIDTGLIDTDGSESLSITIAGVPEGALLSAGVDNGDGSYSLTQGELSGLTVAPPLNSDGDFTLSVTATATEAVGGDTAVSTGTITVNVGAVADAPNLTLQPTSGGEDTAIALNIDTSLVDADGSESLGITIEGVPDGAALSAGTDNGDGSYTLTTAQLTNLTITPPLNSDGDFTLSVTATTTEADGGDTAVSTGTITVGVDAVADAPNLTLQPAAGGEDTAIALDIDTSLVDADGSESLTITIGGVPDGAVLSAGTDNGDGTFSLAQAELTGLTITPPLNSDGEFTLSVTATSTEADGGDTAVTTGTISVDVGAVADAPSLTLQPTSGGEDTAIALNIDTSLVDADGSESLGITIEGVPDGAVLSAGTNNGDGSYTLSQSELTGLTITPPLNSDVDFTLSVTATSTEADGGDTAISTGTIAVGVTAIADTPSLVLQTSGGGNSLPIALDIDASLADLDGSESLSITICGMPDGASLSAGTDNGDGSYTLSPADLSGLTITPPLLSESDFALTVTATATEADGGDTASQTGTLVVDLTPGAIPPGLSLQPASGNEDTAIALDIDASLVDTDGSESLSITISGVPDGAQLSAGSDNGDGSYTLTAADLQGLTVTPPLNSDVDFTLTVAAAATEAEGGDVAVSTGTIEVDVSAVADMPTLTLQAGSGAQDTAITLDIDAGLVDTDGSESLSITIDGVPDGASLSAGENNGNGTWTLTEAQLADLTITPPAGSESDFTLTVTATATEADGGDTAVHSGTINIDLTPGAEPPSLTLQGASGDEDTAIALDVDVSLVDTDGSESLSITIGGVPDGAVLSTGTDNGDGTFSLTQAELTGLTITPPLNSDGDFTLTVTATATEADGGSTAVSSGTIAVGVNAVADTPSLTLQPATGAEDTAIALDIDAGLVDTDGSESLSITIGGVPEGAALSAGIDNGDGTFTLTGAELTGLTITPPLNSDGDFTLTVTATATEADGGDSALSTGSITVGVDAVTDTPSLTLQPATGAEDSAIALDIDASLVDADGSESLSITIGGVPDGAELSAGTANGDGSYTLAVADLDGLTITPPLNSDEEFTLTVTATSTEADGGDTAASTGTLTVDVSAVADTPSLTLQAGTGSENTPISLTIDAGLADTDGSESLSITIGGVPDGATLSAGADNGDGTWSLTEAQLANLTITPPANSESDFTLTVTATATEADGGDTAVQTGSILIDLTPGAEPPNLTLQAATGDEDTAIALDIDASLVDTDGSESLSVTIGGVPAGAELSAGTNNGDGTFTLTQAELAGLTITPPENSDGDFTLTVTATSTEADGGDTAVSTGTFTVDVNAVADTPGLTLQPATGAEDSAIALDIDAGLVDTDGSESLSITIGGVPEGATLSAGTNNGDGTYTLSQAQLTSLTITPPANSDGDFTLTVTATATEADGGDTASSSGTIVIDLTPGADAPSLTLQAASGSEDTAIVLDIDASLIDTDGSEVLSITIADVPEGATLSAGSDNGDGTWTLSPGDLSNLTITPPANSNSDFTLSVQATSTEAGNGESAVTSGTIDVGVTGVADSATAIAQDDTGTEGQWTQLHLDSQVSVDTDGSESLSITISDVPEGAMLSPGVDQGGGVWSVTAQQLPLVCIRPPADFSGDMQLTLNVTTTENDGDSTTQSEAFTVSVIPDADAPNISLEDAAGSEDTAIALDIDASLVDLDGSESLSVTIADVPEGATLSAGTDNGDGTWSLSPGDLANLTITPPANSDSDFTLAVSAVSTEASNGDTAVSTGSLTVSVDAVADTPSLTLQPATGGENTTIALDIGSALTDLDGSESLSITIGGVPDGAFLSAGTDNGDGTWTLTEAELADLTITAGSATPFEATLTKENVLSTDNGFTVTARKVGPNGELSEASANNLITSSDGIGVAGFTGAAAPSNQLGYHIGEGVSEQLIISLDQTATSADVEINRLFQSEGTDGEGGHWQAMLDGAIVGEGDFSATSGHEVGFTIQLEGNGEFDALIFTATEYVGGQGGITNDASDYLIESINFSKEAQSTFDLSVTATSTEADGGDSATTTGSLTVSLVENQIINGTRGSDTLLGGAGFDTISGSNGADFIDGGAGDDVIDGGEGSDVLTGGAGVDVIDGGSDRDTIDGGEGDDVIDGGRSDDIIFGGAGEDTIDGGRHDDTITGGLGNDTLDGGEGDDLLLFEMGDGSDVVDGGIGDTDVLHLDNVGDFGQDWTVNLDPGSSISQQSAGLLELSQDASGTISLSDGSEISFEGIESIEF